jgi:general secretion pathway protein J
MTRTPSGFTLVELVIALFITAIIFAMGYGAVNQTLAHRGELEEQQARLLAVQTTMRLFAQDFGQIVARPVREPIGDGWQPSVESSADAKSTGGGQALISLTRSGWANPAGIQRPALQRVTYTFENGTLFREYYPVLDAILGSKMTRREVLKDIRSVNVRYLQGPKQWVDQWPTQPIQSTVPFGAQRQRPMAIEVTVDLHDWGKIVRLFEIPR